MVELWARISFSSNEFNWIPSPKSSLEDFIIGSWTWSQSGDFVTTGLTTVFVHISYIHFSYAKKVFLWSMSIDKYFEVLWHFGRYEFVTDDNFLRGSCLQDQKPWRFMTTVLVRMISPLKSSQEPIQAKDRLYFFFYYSFTPWLSVCDFRISTAVFGYTWKECVKSTGTDHKGFWLLCPAERRFKKTVPEADEKCIKSRREKKTRNSSSLSQSRGGTWFQYLKQCCVGVSDGCSIAVVVSVLSYCSAHHGQWSSKVNCGRTAPVHY